MKAEFSRRGCLKQFGGISLLALAGGRWLGGQISESTEAGAAAAIRHLGLSVKNTPLLSPTEPMVTGFRRFGWNAFAVGGPGNEQGVGVLAGLGEAAPSLPKGSRCWLRLTNAIDVRDDHAIEVSLPDGRLVGTMVVRFAGLYQVQQMPLSVELAAEVLKQGALLKMVKGGTPLWFFAPSPEAQPGQDLVQLPHVMVAAPNGGSAEEEFEKRLRGLVMLQGFGWQSGCVSEGILDLAEKRPDEGWGEVVDRYLSMYFTDDGVRFESPRSHPMVDKVGGVEEPLPWATLARRKPDHPALEIARKFLLSERITKWEVSRGQALTTEGNYTAAYPSAVLAKVLKNDELAHAALRHLEARRLTNVHDGDIYQSANMAGKGRLRNWCRGTCWYYLGMIRTLQALDDEKAAASWLPEIRRVAGMLKQHQREDGLWGNFIDDPQSAADTSGSAGLAAALARAHAASWLGDEFGVAARKALSGLRKHLTPDGLLGGAAQSNKGGDALQSGDYRVIYQMGMGLKAQLVAALQTH